MRRSAKSKQTPAKPAAAAKVVRKTRSNTPSKAPTKAPAKTPTKTATKTPVEPSRLAGPEAARATGGSTTLDVAGPESLAKRLAEALEQQAATAEILRVISISPSDLQPVFDIIAESAVRLCDAEVATVTRFDGEWVHLGAIYGSNAAGIEALRRTFPMRPSGAGGAVRAIRDRALVHIPDVMVDAQYRIQDTAVTAGFRAVLAVPMLRDGRAIGAITLGRHEPGRFSDTQIQLLRAFADQAIIAVQNVRLFNELEARNRDLTEALEQQTATAEILRAISGSPTDIQPVLDTVARAAARFCGATDVAILRLDGAVLRGAAAVGQFHDVLVSRLGQLSSLEIPVTRGTVTGRAVLERRAIHVHDLATDDEFPEGRELQRRFGHRTMVATPLLREGTPLGAVALFRMHVEPFSDRQLDLLRLFADQAVIAIENVRLFTELQARNGDLAESLERQTATSDVLKVISRSAFDLQPVLQVLAENATRLCASDWALFYRFDGQVLRVIAHHGAPPELLRWFSAGGEGTELRPGRGSVTGRAAAALRTVHVTDVLTDPEFEVFKAQHHGGFRAALGVPMLRDGNLVGVFFLARNEPRAFTDAQVELVTTFADQAVIAIENVRLFNELDARNRELTETLEQQTATGEILRVISRSPTDVQPVFDAIVQSATRLCDASFATVHPFDGATISLAAHHAITDEELRAARSIYPRPVGRDTASGRAIVEGRVVHIHDVREDPEYGPPEIRRALGFRTVLAVPMLHEGRPIGAMSLWRRDVRPFGDKQIALMTTFADQAVIAVQNVRLFTEVQARNRDLAEALERQTATSEVLKVISRSAFDLQAVLQVLAENATRLCAADWALFYRFDGEVLRFIAHHGAPAELLRWFSAGGETAVLRPGRGSVTGRAAAERRTTHVPDVLADPEFEALDAQMRGGNRAGLGVPMLRDGSLVGVFFLARHEPKPFTDGQIELVTTFADQAVIAIENVRLFNELDARNRDLTETLEQQTATGEILRVISSSPTDVQPVFDTIAQSAARLCEAQFCFVFRFDGQLLHLAAHSGLTPEGAAALARAWPNTPNRGTAAGRSVLDGVSHIPDVRADPDYAHGAVAEAATFRSVVAVPMMRDGAPIGTITLNRSQVGLFPDRQIELLKTFADQAVIAIENVRLFTELEQKNSALIQAHAKATEALEQQTATAEILRVISRSPTDVQPTFEAIAASATRLCRGINSLVIRFDGRLMHLAAHHNLTPERRAALEQIFPIAPSRGSMTGRAILTRAVAQTLDISQDVEYALPSATTAGYRSAIAVPILREGAPIGAVLVARDQVAPFSDKQIGLLKTFADQAVIAIENVRLFTELDARNRDLTETLEQQTATGEILRVISSSPTDVQPVFDTIVASALKLCDATFGGLLRFDGEVMHVAAAHNVEKERLEAFDRLFPMRPTRDVAIGRAILDRTVVHFQDVLAEPSNPIREASRQALDYRAWLAVPMIRDETPLGVIFCWRREPRAFTDTQVALVQTFADQAVIAIENVRLFTELEARNAELTDTLSRQTATAEVLRAISRAHSDAQPVFDIIVASALRLCGAGYSWMAFYDGELLHHAALQTLNPEGAEASRRAYPRRPGEGSAEGRAIRTRDVVHIPDMLHDPTYELRTEMETLGLRSLLAVPMLRDGKPIAVIGVAQVEPRPFTQNQIELLKTFADQGVIAIENVRLFKELEARNRDLTETLEQQTATSEVLKLISRSTFDLQPVLETLIENATRLCRADFGVMYRFDGELQRLAAAYNVPASLRDFVEKNPLGPGRGTAVGRAAIEGRTVHIHDVRADPEYTYAASTVEPYRTIVGVPMLREGVPVGVFAVVRGEVRPFTDKQIELVTTFADQAVIAIENVRLFQALEARNRDLTETLEQQTATGEILRVISSSPTDAQPVFDMIARSAVRLCDALYSAVNMFDGEVIHLPVAHNYTPEALAAVARMYPMPPSRRQLTGRAVLSRRVAHIPDVLADPEYAPEIAVAGGWRSGLAVPMLREGQPIGTILVTRAQAGPFSDRQVDLLTTFADQAVIAIENVRLFRELETRTGDLTRSVGELKALGEVSQAVGSTLDSETVLATIVTHAVQLSGSHSGIVYEFDETTQTFHARATHRITSAYLETVRAAPIRLGEGAVGHAGVIRQPVEVADVEAEPDHVAPQARTLFAEEGIRSLLAVPLVREERLLGGLVILRRERGAFSPEVVATLQTFAAQSVLAINNARLFREIQRQKQYSEALVETSPVAIATVDLSGRVIGWNPAAERLFGYAPAEALGRHMEELVSTEESRDEVAANIRRTLAGDWIRAIARRARKDGTPVDVEISSVPVVVDGAKVGMIGIYHDITELLRARREAEAANEAKGAFLATMSHEIRTPMNAVIGMSGLLLNTPLTDEQREYAEIVRQSGDTLLTVINDILDFSKIEAGKLELESQPFDLLECVESALDLVATRAAEKGLDLAYLVADGTPEAIVGDVTRLRQILLNLLSNAVKFTERGEVVISVSGQPLDGPAGLHALTFSVRDTGIGIPADRLGRLFQSFSQVDASTTRRYGGTGLGLAISQRLAELMGGRIDVTSEVGTGSEFRFTIRAAAAARPASARRDLRGPQPSLHGKRVLVVDDNATNRRIVLSHLSAWGLPARATESPREALDWIQAGEEFDVGILDMHMPEMDGVALARAIREERAGAALPLILFTSLGRREARADSEAFAAHLHKPIKPSQLFDALVSVLAEHPAPAPQRVAGRSELDPDMARRHPLRILLAEDNVVNQKLALRLLAQMGYRADLAANGLEAIEAISRQTYDVVLMDVQMPEMDGFEASREINRRWPGERRPRIVAMTANAMQGDRELCVAAGMDDYVAKPIRVEELVSALERSAARSEPRIQAAPAPSRVEVGALRTDVPAVVAAPPPVADRSGAAAPGSRVPEGPPGKPPIDRKVFERLVAAMGGAFVAELIGTFVEDAGTLVATLHRALIAKDVDGFRRAAHSLKSNAATLGAHALADLSRELENTARDRHLPTPDRLEPLARAHEGAVQALEEFRRDLPS